MTTIEIMKNAVAVRRRLASVCEEQKNAALANMADELVKSTDEILLANSIDIEAARGIISEVMTDRLALDKKRILSMAEAIRDIIKLPDPVGRALKTVERPNGLVINKVSVPIGVVAIIFESRPNVTSDAASLALKSGNVCIMRSGKEAHRSCKAITDALRRGIELAGLPADCVQLVDDTSRESSVELMNGVGYIDLLIPRGGAGLIKACVENARVPCIQTGTGICHVYVDKQARLENAISIINNAKTSRPSVCNAEEVCLVHKDIAKDFLPMLKNELVDKRRAEGKIPVELRLDKYCASFIDGTPANEKDFDTEFLDYILSVKAVGSVQEAVEHISAHSTGHSDAIVTENRDTAAYFTDNVDSAAVYVNASTRFTDGGEFGLGCELGISTQKMHARGPMGLEEMTTYKYVIHGNGQIR